MHLCDCVASRSLQQRKGHKKAKQQQWQHSCVTRTVAQARCWLKDLDEIRLRSVRPTPAAVQLWLVYCSTAGPKSMLGPCLGISTEQQRQRQPGRENKVFCRLKAGIAVGVASTHNLGITLCHAWHCIHDGAIAIFC
jgi:hypothetical protein